MYYHSFAHIENKRTCVFLPGPKTVTNRSNVHPIDPFSITDILRVLWSLAFFQLPQLYLSEFC